MPQSRVFAVVGKTVVDLQGEFPRGRQNQCPDGAVLFFSVRPASPVAAGPARFIGGSRFSSNVLFVFFQQVLQDRDGECRRFTRSCLRDAENVFSPKNYRDCLLLDGSRFVISFFADGPRYGFCNVQFVKCHNNVSACADVFDDLSRLYFIKGLWRGRNRLSVFRSLPLRS